jgi:hypothetical protein
VRVHSHDVIIAGTCAEVTPGHNFVIRVADALWTRFGTPWETLFAQSSTLRSSPAGLAENSHGTCLSAQRTNLEMINGQREGT